MTNDSRSASPPLPRPLLAGVALAVVLGVWILSRLFTTDAARFCADRYSAGTTAADSARVDSLVPDSAQLLVTCGMMKTNGRWR